MRPSGSKPFISRGVVASITDAGLQVIGEWSSLQSLELSKNPVTGDGLVHLKSLFRLERLGLSGNLVTDSGLAQVKELLVPTAKLYVGNRYLRERAMIPRVPRFVILALISLLTATRHCEGATYFVSPEGNDRGTGTEDDPWQTLQRAANLPRPGDVIRVAPGRYRGFHLTRSGTASSPIVFQADANAVINEPNRRTGMDGINLEGASHVVIDGFEVSGMPRAGIRAVGTSSRHSRFVSIRNNHTDQNGVWGIFTGYSEDLLIEHNETSRSIDEHGIYISNSADRPTVRHNVSWGNAASGIQLNADGNMPGDGIIAGALITHNQIYDNGRSGGAGLNLDGVQDSRVENNLLYGNHATGIALFRQDGSDGSKSNAVVNNTVVNAEDGRWALTVAGGSTRNTVTNNIFFSEHTYRGGIDVRTDSLAEMVSNHNAVEDRFTVNGGDSVMSLAEWQRRTGQDKNSIKADPTQLFVNPADGDYHLSDTSSAIDAGIATLAPALDFDGKPRPIGPGYDLGAFEAGQSTALQAGDANQDLRFDQLDLVQVQLAAKYYTGQAATWGEGDWDGAPGGSQGNPPMGNGLFDQFDIIAALHAGVYLTGPYVAVGTSGVRRDDQVAFGYDGGTGERPLDGLDRSKQYLWTDPPVVGSLAEGGAIGDLGLICVPEPASVLLLALVFVWILSPANRGLWGRYGRTVSLRMTAVSRFPESCKVI